MYNILGPFKMGKMFSLSEIISGRDFFKNVQEVSSTVYCFQLFLIQ